MRSSYLDQRLFLRVVELGSLRAVSRDYGMETSSVSRRLTALEARLGVKLLDRSGGAARVTDDGQRYYESLRRLLAQLDALEDGLGGVSSDLSGMLRVLAPPEIGRRLVAGWLRGFQADHPGVSYHLALLADTAAPRPAPDLVIAQDFSSGRFPGHCRLATVPQVLVAAPDYLERHGTPATALDLVNHVHVLTRPDGPSSTLRLTAPEGRRQIQRRTSQVTITDHCTAADATRDGAGILLAPEWLVHNDLASGALQRLLPGHKLDPGSLHMVWRDTSPQPAQISAFVAHARAQVAQVPGLIPDTD
ncbi:MAG: LysR family transcriptional regulator [Rhodobacteraceae bacterium]|nr:LysR family transcriptional regulator [Paracoccaceae bacterium]